MRELIPTIEGALGPDRLSRLKRDEDEYQDFWTGVLSALERVDWSRDAVAYLVSAGYGAVRNSRRKEWTDSRYRHCPKCGRIFGYRMVTCPKCGTETESDVRSSELLEVEGRGHSDEDIRISIEQFIDTLSGTSRYVARRWMLDRADLKYQNHVKQIAFELGLSPPRVSQIKGMLRREFQAFLNWEAPEGH